MAFKVIPEEELAGKKIEFPENYSMVYMKLIGIGPNTVEKVGGQPSEVPSTVDGFFIVDESASIREQLHQMIDRFCDKQGGVT